MRVVGLILVVVGGLCLGFGSLATAGDAVTAGDLPPPVVSGIALTTGLLLLSVSGGRSRRRPATGPPEAV